MVSILVVFLADLVSSADTTMVEAEVARAENIPNHTKVIVQDP